MRRVLGRLCAASLLLPLRAGPVFAPVHARTTVSCSGGSISSSYSTDVSASGGRSTANAVNNTVNQLGESCTVD